MAYRIQIDPDENCAFIFHWGDEVAVARDVSQALLELRASPDYRRGMNIVRDLRAMTLDENAQIALTTLAFDESLISAYENFDRQHGKARFAVVTNWPGDGTKEMAFFVRLAHTPMERKWFKDLNDALEWLGLPPDYDLPDEAARSTVP